MEGVFIRAYFLETETRKTIIVDLECPSCGNILTTEGDFVSRDDFVKFKAITICPHCFKDYGTKGGLSPYKRVAYRWVRIAKACDIEHGSGDAKACYFETVNMQILKRSNEKKIKRRKESSKWDQRRLYDNI